MISRDRAFQHHIAAPRHKSVDKQCGNHRRNSVAKHFLPDHRRHSKPLQRLPFRRCRSRQLDAPLVITDNSLIAILKNDIAILRAHKMLVCRHSGCEKPLFSGCKLTLGLTVERVDPASRARHRCHIALGHLTLVVISHPSVDISASKPQLPFAAIVVPVDNGTQRLLPLTIFKIALLAIVGGQHRKLAI